MASTPQENKLLHKSVDGTQNIEWASKSGGSTKCWQPQIMSYASQQNKLLHRKFQKNCRQMIKGSIHYQLYQLNKHPKIYSNMIQVPRHTRNISVTSVLVPWIHISVSVT